MADPSQELRQRTRESQRLHALAQQVAVDAVQAPAKLHSPFPIYTVRGQGSHVWDVDGNDYIDYVLGLGPLLLGHGHPVVEQRLRDQLSHFVLAASPNPLEVELAQKLVHIVPCADACRFTTSATEANMLAVRLARAYTGREVILRVRNDYVGWADAFTPGMFVPDHEPGGGQPWGLGGVPRSVQRLTRSFDFNDTEGFARLIQRVGNDKVAAVIMEPSFRGVLMPQPGFLESIRSLTTETGAVLIFDEVVSGFRFGLQGGQGYFGVTPDLATYGKTIGGGLPVGAVLGRRDIMDRLSATVPALERVYHSGTWPGMPLVCAAALAVLEVLEQPETYPRLNRVGDLFAAEMRKVIQRHEVPLSVLGIGPLREIAFTDEPVLSPRQKDLLKVRPEAIHELWMALALEGSLALGKGYMPTLRFFISLAHTDADILKTVDTLDRAILRVLGRG
ncbi:MAG: aminotransferase class III-fold pyridoxal phosphate-dependent enzyme [Chloroflexi bacterium]|nr:aminotransferase class III-fold pyridoxal phosphate-dependent enzyme [Chloroflexota bacterium]